jgi:hypothetical protein
MIRAMGTLKKNLVVPAVIDAYVHSVESNLLKLDLVPANVVPLKR